MTQSNHCSVTEMAEREIVLTRAITAPREAVFQAWTDPNQVDLWWGPRGFTNSTKEMDVRPGGVWRYVMHGPDGLDCNNKVSYIDVVKPERLLYAHGSEDDSDFDTFHVTVTLADSNGKTDLTMRTLFDTAEQCRQLREFGCVELGNQTLDRLEEYLAQSKRRV